MQSDLVALIIANLKTCQHRVLIYFDDLGVIVAQLWILVADVEGADQGVAFGKAAMHVG